MKIWRFGIVGAGVIADFHARVIAELDNCELVGVCDGGSGRARKLAKKYNCQVFADYKKIARSNDIDILSIATPSGLHAEPAIAAAENSKHVICEKPLEISLGKIDQMAQAHQRSGTLLGGIFQNRFADSLQPLRQAVRNGRFGRITFVGAYLPWWRGEDYYKDSWHGTWEFDGGGALMNQSIHIIDTVCELMGPVRTVQATVGTLGHKNMQAEDTAAAVLQFDNDAIGVIYGSTASWPGRPKRLEITGTAGTVVYVEESFTVWQFAQETDRDEQIRKEFGPSQSTGGASDPAAIDCLNHKRNFQAFIKALESGEPFEIDPAEARKSVELILAIYESSRRQRLIKLIP